MDVPVYFCVSRLIMHLFMPFFAPLDSDLGDTISGSSRPSSRVMKNMPILGRAGESMDRAVGVRARGKTLQICQRDREEVLASDEGRGQKNGVRR